MLRNEEKALIKAMAWLSIHLRGISCEFSSNGHEISN